MEVLATNLAQYLSADDNILTTWTNCPDQNYYNFLELEALSSKGSRGIFELFEEMGAYPPLQAVDFC